MSGIVQGGWGYVWAAYLVTAAVLGGYTIRTIVLHRIGKRLSDYE